MKVGIIGAGTMGSGIAQVFAQTEGYTVALCDINNEFAANGKKKIAKGFAKRVEKGKMEQAEADAILARIETGTKEICKDCDLVVEAALENLEIKKQTFKELQAIVGPDAIFATNTSIAVDHSDRRRPRPPGHRHAFLQPGPGHEARRNHCRPQHAGRAGRQDPRDF